MPHMLWTANIINEKEEKENFEKYLQNNQRLLIRLREILEEKQNSLQKKENSITSYESAGWPYAQAHINGKQAAYEEIKQLTNLG